MTDRVPYRYEQTFQVRRGPALSRRSHIAWWLRRLADRIDGFTSLTYMHLSMPTIPQKQVDQCIQRGVLHAGKLLKEEAKIAAIDGAMVEAGWDGDANETA
jgi:hypothetical protein